MADVFPMEALPPEMQRMIFFEILKLPRNEFQKCRSVCKSWMEAIDSVRYDGLTIKWKRHPGRPQYISPEYEPVLTDGYVRFKTNAFFKHLPRQQIFKNIRKMVTFAEDILSPFQKKFYNHFELLEDLKIAISPYLPSEHHFRREMLEIQLDLKFLKKLHVTSNRSRFILKTPQLETLKCFELGLFTIQHPESIKHLDVDHSYSSFYQFLSGTWRLLETLVVRSHFIENSNDLFKRLPNLREVHFPFLFRDLHRFDTDYSRAAIKVEFFFFGIERAHFRNYPKKRKHVSPFKLETVPFRQNTQFILNNWQVINCRNFYEPQIDYKPLEEFNLNSFCEKFPKVSALALREGVKNEENLCRFLEKTKPDDLIMRVCKMSPSFLNKLPKRCGSIRGLQLDLARMKNISNLDFVFKMKHLLSFTSTQFFSFSFLKRLVSEIQSLTTIRFLFNSYCLSLYLNDYLESTVSFWPAKMTTGRAIIRASRFSFKTIKHKTKRFPDREDLLGFLNEIEPQLNELVGYGQLIKFHELLMS